MTHRESSLWYWVVRLLPKKLIYFCFMKVMAHATTGKYGDTVVPQLTGVEAAQRFGNDFGI